MGFLMKNFIGKSDFILIPLKYKFHFTTLPLKMELLMVNFVNSVRAS